MSEALYPYYERELVFIRQLAQDFAKHYPAAAGRLLLEPNRSVDPHVERLIESFALLAGRIHHKLDDEFPELTESLLGTLYPHYLAPIPSMAIVQFDVDPHRGPLPKGFLINRHTRLHTAPVSETPCRFRTAYPVTLWPIVVKQAQLVPPPFPAGVRPPPQTASILTLHLELESGLRFADLALDTLRFYLAGDNHVVAQLYELIFHQVIEVQFRSTDGNAAPEVLNMSPTRTLCQVGFERDEGLFPYPNRAFLGYRLLTELFAFPNKFHFVDVGGFSQLRQAKFGKSIEITFFLRQKAPALEQAITAQSFRLGCTPVVNLFDQIAEPIPLTHSRYEYRIVPDVALAHGMEVYSVDSVSSTDPVTGATTDYQPFYSFRHGQTEENQQAFWYATRRLSVREGDRGTDVFLNLVDLHFQPTLPAEATLVVRTTCTNRNLPVQLQRFGDQLHLELEAAAPLSAVRCLRAPTLPLRPPLRRGAHWRLLSHLSLNHLSISDAEEGREAFQEILRLYDFSDSESGQQLAAVNRHLIEGILSLTSRRVVGRTGSGGFCRGVEVTMEFDEQKYVGTGVFLFASVLERFLALYSSLNSFTQLIVKTKQGEGYLKKWQPRAGARPLL